MYIYGAWDSFPFMLFLASRTNLGQLGTTIGSINNIEFVH